MNSDFTEPVDHVTEPKAGRTTVSILRTVLRLLEDDPAIRVNSETLQEFRQAATKLIAEIQSEQGITDDLFNSRADESRKDNPF